MRLQIILHYLKKYNSKGYVCTCGHEAKDYESHILHCNINKLRKREC
jgi:hypothetical protein